MSDLGLPGDPVGRSGFTDGERDRFDALGRR
jgi:hypothetical protein